MKLPGVVAAVAVVVVVVVTGSLASIFSYADAHILPHLLTLTLTLVHTRSHTQIVSAFAFSPFASPNNYS